MSAPVIHDHSIAQTQRRCFKSTPHACLRNSRHSNMVHTYTHSSQAKNQQLYRNQQYTAVQDCSYIQKHINHVRVVVSLFSIRPKLFHLGLHVVTAGTPTTLQSPFSHNNGVASVTEPMAARTAKIERGHNNVVGKLR